MHGHLRQAASVKQQRSWRDWYSSQHCSAPVAWANTCARLCSAARVMGQAAGGDQGCKPQACNSAPGVFGSSAGWPRKTLCPRYLLAVQTDQPLTRYDQPDNFSNRLPILAAPLPKNKQLQSGVHACKRQQLLTSPPCQSSGGPFRGREPKWPPHPHPSPM